MFFDLRNSTSPNSYKSFKKDISSGAARSGINAGSVSLTQNKASLTGKTTVSNKYRLVFHYLICPRTCGNAFVLAVKDTQPIRKNIAQNTRVLFDGNVKTLRGGTEKDKEKSQSFSRFELFDSRESPLSILIT
jgi:hypothetical protein